MDADFRFSCHEGLECFGDCCRDANVFLTPFDILRMKNGLGISSGEFLKKYTGMLLGETGPPVLFLEMKSDEEKSCPFLGEKGCDIYENRPGLCRTFPLKAVGMGNYRLIEDVKCDGLNEGPERTLEGWQKDQGIDAYSEIDDLYKEITLEEKLLKKNMQDASMLGMFFMAFDVDKFKSFVFESKFLRVFDVSDKEIKRMKADDVELLKFAFKWLKFGLIDKEALKMKDSVLNDQKE
jgi:Fe-S-cluster containining protein